MGRGAATRVCHPPPLTPKVPGPAEGSRKHQSNWQQRRQPAPAQPLCFCNRLWRLALSFHKGSEFAQRCGIIKLLVLLCGVFFFFFPKHKYLQGCIGAHSSSLARWSLAGFPWCQRPLSPILLPPCLPSPSDQDQQLINGLTASLQTEPSLCCQCCGRQSPACAPTKLPVEEPPPPSHPSPLLLKESPTSPAPKTQAEGGGWSA